MYENEHEPHEGVVGEEGVTTMYENEHEPCEGVPAMTPTVVHDYLARLGEEWSGRGVAVELGSWLGGTAVPLLRGLERAGYDRPFYAYDRWEATEDEVRKAVQQGTKILSGARSPPDLPVEHHLLPPHGRPQGGRRAHLLHAAVARRRR